jgi:hypothetical protein
MAGAIFPEQSADTYHDQIRRGQHKSQNEQQPLQNAAPDSEEYMISMQNLIPHAGNVLFVLGGGVILMQFQAGHVPIYLGLGAYGHGPCPHSLHFLARSTRHARA